MKKENLSSLEVIHILTQGQTEIAADIQKGVEDYWDPKHEGVAFMAFVNEIMLHKVEVNWWLVFGGFELIVCDTVRTHVLEHLSNAVANKNLAPECLIENAGPLARAHMKSWELAMDGKTIF
jgi:hypothetical protein